MADSVQTRLLEGLRQILQPIAAAVDGGRINEMLAEMGWQVDSVDELKGSDLLAALADVPSALNDLLSVIQNPPSTLQQLPGALAKVDRVVADVLKLETLFQGSALQDLRNLPLQLLKYETAQLLLFWRPGLYFLLRLLGVIRDTVIGITTAVDSNGRITLARRQVIIPQLDFDQLMDVLKDPVATLKKEYLLENGLQDPNATADKLFPRLVDFLTFLQMEAVYGVLPNLPVDFGTVGNVIAARTLRVYKTFPTDDDSLSRIGAAIYLDRDLGLVMVPVGAVDLSADLDRWSIHFQLSAGGTPIAVKDGNVRFPQGAGIQSLTASLDAAKIRAREESGDGDDPVPVDGTLVRLGGSTGTRFEFGDFTFGASATFSTSGLDYGFDLKASRAAIIISGGDGDGLMSSILPKESRVDLDFKVGWSNKRGLNFGGRATLDLTLPFSLTIGPITVDMIRLLIGVAGGAIDVGTLANVKAKLGPIGLSVQDIGPALHLTFPDGGGNVGPANADIGFKPPSGIGIAVNGGPVSGGGFLSFEDSKYSGALALSVYAVAVKAFGIIETKFPDGHRGFSFIIIISAEFTPIQLGFGFTLNGVGGILGINRDLNEDALRDVVQRGSMGNVLFPKDPIKDAPSILHDIAQLFPAADGHFVFGPMAILAWGTPAIVEARLGIIIVFPGPRIALLGTVQVLLPPGTGQQAPEKRLVEIHLDIAGVLDFPKKHFALDAHLHDSNVVGFPISGDMAARIDWGANPNMVIAMGGFHPHFTPPAGFPKLRRLSIDLGIKGNPTATLSGYMAVTSNTAQIGAALDVTASAAGASLKGGLAFDAIFVFSPFSFDATLEGGVHVDFHGAGFGMHFHGEISGPAPWHLKGDVCVSILWWDACVGFNLTLGGEKKPELPAVDVWAGSAEVPGLQSAIAAPGNWTALMPPNGYQAVSLRETDASSASRVDPLGTAKFEQKVLPFTLAISKFAGRDRAKNDAVKVTLNKVVIDGDDLVAGGRVNPESDFFAPAQYQKLPDAQALSSPSFQPMQAGFSFTSKDLKAGVEKTKVISFQTFVVGNPGTGQVSDFPVNDNQLLAMTGRSAVATGGLRTGNIDRFVDFGKQPAFTFTTEAYALAFKSTLKRFTTAADDAAYALTADKLAAQPADVRGTLQIVPVHELAA